VNAILILAALRRARFRLPVMAATLVLFTVMISAARPAFMGPEGSPLLRLVPAGMVRAIAPFAGGDLTRLTTTEGYLAATLAHPFVILIMALAGAGSVLAGVAGELDRGTTRLVLSRPVSRVALVTSELAAATLGVLALSLALLAGQFLGSQLYGFDLDMRSYGLAIVSLLLVGLAMTGLGALAAAWNERSGAASSLTIAVIAGSYLLDYLTQLWEPIRFLGPASLFHWYRPIIVATGGTLPLSEIAVLGSVFLVASVAAMAIFERRNL
jgi:ABC-2 type transport system permease protein